MIDKKLAKELCQGNIEKILSDYERMTGEEIEKVLIKRKERVLVKDDFIIPFYTVIFEIKEQP